MIRRFHYLVTLGLLAFLAASCESRNDESTQILKNQEFSRYSIEGLHINLPSSPSPPTLLPISPRLEFLIKRQAGYEASIEGCGILIFHLVQSTGMPVNMDFAIEGSLEDMKKVPGTTDFQAMVVDGYDLPDLKKKKELLIRLKANGLSKCVRVMVICHEYEMFQITIEGEEDLVEEVASKVFPSIKIVSK